MRRLLTIPFLATALVSGPVHSQSQSTLTPQDEQMYVKELSDCITRKSTGDDRITLAKWFVAILASSPNVKGVAKLEPGTKDKLDISAARIFTRLLTVDCAVEAKPLWKARSSAGFRTTGEALGRLAFQEVMAGDSEMFSGYVSHINPADFKALED